MTTKTSVSFSALPKDYHALVRLFAPRPIHDRVGYDNTVEFVDAMAGHALNRDQEDYLEILSRLVENYEAQTVRPRRKSGLQLLQALVAEHGMTAAALGKRIGVDNSHAAKILRGDRSITALHSKKLSAHFAVTVDALLA